MVLPAKRVRSTAAAADEGQRRPAWQGTARLQAVSLHPRESDGVAGAPKAGRSRRRFELSGLLRFKGMRDRYLRPRSDGHRRQDEEVC